LRVREEKLMKGESAKAKRARAAEAFVKASAAWDGGKQRAALALFLVAARLGDDGAQINAGYLYDVGLGVKRNRAEAMRWYKRAYRRGNRSAASNIATIFRDEGNVKRALSWFDRAIGLGDADANVEAARMLLREKGREAEATRYLKRALKARSRDITQGGREDARNMLSKVQKRKRGNR
jgi:TPR repeat protein